MKARKSPTTIYKGHKHFDWSFIEENYPEDHITALFREPRARAVSHFHFAQTLDFSKGTPLRDLTLRKGIICIENKNFSVAASVLN